MYKRIRPSVRVNKYEDLQPYANTVIDKFGGNDKLAKILNVTLAAVSYWRKSGLPQRRILELKLLRPDLAGELDAKYKTVIL